LSARWKTISQPLTKKLGFAFQLLVLLNYLAGAGIAREDWGKVKKQPESCFFTNLNTKQTQFQLKKRIKPFALMP
jgi:hypothetical protein